jgi:hypothetical protein
VGLGRRIVGYCYCSGAHILSAAEKQYKDQLVLPGRKLATLMVIRDVRHRWNYTHAMIQRARLLREVRISSQSSFIAQYYNTQAIDTWVLERPEIRPLLLKGTEWSFLESFLRSSGSKYGHSQLDGILCLL